MIRIPGRIPIFIHPFFWLIAGFIGFINSQSLVGTLVWIGVVFISILVHELGHALTALAFQRPARIDLVAFGGITSYPIGNLSYKKQFLIVFNGPFFGFLLFLLANYLTTFPFFHNSSLLFFTLRIMVFVNFFWTLLNLLPVIPLDGGQLLRIVLEGIWGVKGFKAALLIGTVLSLGIALFAFLYQNFILGALFFLFAFQSFDHFRKAKFFSQKDQDVHLKEKFLEGEKALQAKDKEKAKHLFEEFRKEAKEGVLFCTATQYLAFLYFEEGKKKEAYELLLSTKEQLAQEGIPLLHLLAEGENNHALVAELSSSCYEISPTQEVALRNAKAFARLNDPVPSAGWLQRAWSLHPFDVESLLKEEAFSEVKNQEKFIKEIRNLKK